VEAPQPGYLWTPPYWGYDGGHYGFHGGYWGQHVGFYGGINYGGGYIGAGFVGGNWSGGHFRYNTAVSNVNTTVIHNTYINRTVINNTTINNHTSFNGPGGVRATPTPEQRTAMNEHHIQPTARQMQHQQTASKDKGQFASVNHGRPAATAMNKVGGRPFTQEGHVAKNTSFGHQNGAADKAQGTHQANVGQAENRTAPQQHAHDVQPQHTKQPAEQHAQAPKPQQHVEQQHTEAPRPQQHVEQQHTQAPRQQQQHVQPQHAQAPRQQPRSNPRPAPNHEKHG